jgi:TonB family protein
MGAYIGVGPEQNFTYIMGMKPQIAFIIDIRRQNMLQHMLYKAIFELSENRADFLSRLFSRKRPDGLTDKSTPEELFAAYGSAPTDDDAFTKNLREIKNRLLQTHKFGLTDEDQSNIDHVYTVFRNYGPEINYNSGANGVGGRGGGGMPNYTTLMTATDGRGERRSFLANEDNYRFLRDMETKNMIVPLTGDFGGTKALRAVGQYLKDHNATVSAFYLSNVEQYLFQSGRNANGGASNFYGNVATLPLDMASTFIRSGNGGRGGGGGGGASSTMGSSSLSSMQDTVAAFTGGRIGTYNEMFTIAAPDVIYTVGNGVTAPQPINSALPLLPSTTAAREGNVTGSAAFEIIVRSNGAVDPSIVVRRGVGAGFDESLMEAIRQWKFRPATKDNMPVNVRITVEPAFTFK